MGLTTHKDRIELTQMAARGREFIESKWNYDTQFQPVMDCTDSLLNVRRL